MGRDLTGAPVEARNLPNGTPQHGITLDTPFMKMVRRKKLTTIYKRKEKKKTIMSKRNGSILILNVFVNY